MQQRNADINEFKMEAKELAKSRSGRRRVSTATKVSKPEGKASKRVMLTMKIQKAGDDPEVDGEPEAKKVKPDEHEHAVAKPVSDRKESNSAPATVRISALGGYSSDSSE